MRTRRASNVRNGSKAFRRNVRNGGKADVPSYRNCILLGHLLKIVADAQSSVRKAHHDEGCNAAVTSAKNESALRLLVASVIGLAALYTLVLRLIVAWGLPLWIDESWTAVLSSAHSFSDWRHQAWLDSNAPLYYFFIWLWPFESDFGLKLPSLLFLIGSAALAALWRTDSLTRDQRFFWGALIFLWAPGMSLFVDARYYGLLFLLSVAQTVAFLRLVERPSLARASLWTGLSTLAVLSHYYAAIPATAQGLLLLLHLRKKPFQL